MNASNDEYLGDLLEHSLFSLDSFIREKMDKTDEYLDLFGPMKTLLECAKSELRLIADVLAESLGGHIKVETPRMEVYGLLSRRDLGKAYVEPQAQAAAQDDQELDPITKDNIFKDAEKLANMASELQLTAEFICHDLGLPLPEVIQEKISRERAVRQVRRQGGAA